MDEEPLNLPKKMLQKHFNTSLGDFINLFSILENAVRGLMCHLAGTDDATSLALFSGVRTDQAITNIRRLYQARKQQIPAPLDAALQQLAVIAGFRNDLLHHRVDFSRTPPVTTNRATVLNDTAVRETVIDSHTLLNAAVDLGRILLILSRFTYSKAPEKDDNVAFAMLGAWQHKPASQPRSQPRKRHQKRQGPSNAKRTPKVFPG